MPDKPVFNFAALDEREHFGLSGDTYRVAVASALLWAQRGVTDVHRLLSQGAARTTAGRAFTAADVKTAISELRAKGLLSEDPVFGSAFHLIDSLRAPLYRQLLETHSGTVLVQLVCSLQYGEPTIGRTTYYWPISSLPATLAYVRAKFHSGAPSEELTGLRQVITRSLDWGTVAKSALVNAFDRTSFAYIEPGWRWQLALEATATLCEWWENELDPVAEWAVEQLAAGAEQVPSSLREVLADRALQRDDTAGVEAALAGVNSGLASALRAAQLAADGQWAAAQSAFEAALKQCKDHFGSNRGLLPDSIAWFYPLSLLAQQTPRHLELARKFCLAESGRRQANPYEPWGCWVHAIDVRLGNAPLVAGAFAPPADLAGAFPLHALWALLLVAWLGADVVSAQDPGRPAKEWRAVAESTRETLDKCHFSLPRRFLDGALALLENRDPPPGFFVGTSGERWREVLTALQSLAQAPASDDGGESTRLLWAIEIGRQGQLLAINPLEQRRGPRGWNRPRATSLTKITGNEKLPPWDAKVARAIRPIRGYSNRHRLDLAIAIVALVGHPGVVLAHAPEALVELCETAPNLELVRDKDHFRIRIQPSLRTHDDNAGIAPTLAEERRELEALRQLTLLVDGPQRVRLVRFSAAQRQAAQLVSGRFAIPAAAPDAVAEVEKTLQALSSHFQIDGDAAQASRQVESDSRLHAELSPVGEALSLRLMVTPLGSDGPRFPATKGRRRVLAVQGKETVGTERDLNAERRHLDAVLDTLPFLDVGEPAGEWLLEDPEQALTVVETLPTLPAIAAVEWPKGKSVRVVSVTAQQLAVSVSHERDWFRLSGQASVDQGLVLQLDALLAAARQQTRFVSMGNGVYAALTRSLKQKLSDLAAVLEIDKQGARAPAVAGLWLDEVLEGTATETGHDVRQAIERLRQAQTSEPQLPGLLQARLRPYQEDGYQWAMRLADSGLGGCLADDMGLGKTVQAIAVLLQRAPGGAALVIAPTSVCGNWLVEIRRFAPTLNPCLYGEGGDTDREDLLSGAGAQDVVIVSYTLLLLAQERFAARAWHTVVADEAQAIKNAAAKRSQAVFDLDADFRLAMTGTPVENRLGDLWSIMRFANPGLLGNVNRFNERFANPIERLRDRDAQHTLKRLIAPFVLRRNKSDVLQDLPPRTELLLTATPEPVEAAHYEALRREAERTVLGSLGGVSDGQARFNLLAQLTRLRRAACDPRLTSPELGVVGAKVQAFGELVGELIANGHKALVFSQFVDFLSLLRQPLDAAGIAYHYLDGSTPAADRNRRIAAFQAGEGDLFLISLKAGGFGLNLTAADYVVITDPWWNPAAEDQATGRAHRIGQARPVTVYRLVNQGTVEERIVDLHHEKRALADSILAAGEATALPSTDELVALIRG